MTDVFIGEVRRSLRRSLFQKLKPYGLSQDDVTKLVATAVTRAIALSNIRELAVVATAATPVVDALRTADPTNPRLADYDAVRAGLPDRVQELTEMQVVEA